MSKANAPWMKFYPSDWRADPALRMCSIAARGLWIEMLCVMHEAVPYGSLRVNGNPVSDRQIAVLAGADIAETAEWLAELERAGVFSRDEDGVIVSRRMQRDKAKSDADKENGKRGGNPNLRDGVNPPVKGEDKAQKPEARVPDPSSLRSDGGAPKRATRLPADWSLPDEWRQDALDIGLLPSQIDFEADSMRDWSQSASDGARKEWRAMWRNWCRRVVRGTGRPRSPPQRETPITVIDSLLEKMDHADADPTAEIEGHQAAALQLPGWQ